MSALRRLGPNDLFNFNSVNLDPLTETYNVGFYMGYMVRWPGMVTKVLHPDGTIMAYMIGKAEGKEEEWHGHLTALSVAPEFRRLRLAQALCCQLERVSEQIYHNYFVDLFVRNTNEVAVNMYYKFGYSVYRRVLGYYSDPVEDAFDMRKALPRDVDKNSIIPLPHPVTPDDIFFD